jgi:hypothetical protein
MRQPPKHPVVLLCSLLLAGCQMGPLQPPPEPGAGSLPMQAATGAEKPAGTVLCETTPADRQAPSLNSEYRSFSNRHDRLGFCIRLLDKGTIEVGTNMKSIHRVFGADVEDYGFKEGTGKARVILADWVVNPRGDSADALVGWYLALYYTDEGLIYKYFLSNIWKSPDMWGW